MWVARCKGRLVALASTKAQHRLAIAAPGLGLALGAAAGTCNMLVSMPHAASARCEVAPHARKQIGMESGCHINRDQDSVKQTFAEMKKDGREPLIPEACCASEQSLPKNTDFQMQSALGAFAGVGAQALSQDHQASREVPPLPTQAAHWPPTEALRSDPEFMMKAVRHDGGALKYASVELSKHRGLVLEAVRQSGQALEFAAPELRRDRELVLEAVKQSGLALQFAAEELRADRECVLEAIRETGWAMQFASPELQEDAQLAGDGGMGWKTGGY